MVTAAFLHRLLLFCSARLIQSPAPRFAWSSFLEVRLSTSYAFLSDSASFFSLDLGTRSSPSCASFEVSSFLSALSHAIVAFLFSFVGCFAPVSALFQDFVFLLPAPPEAVPVSLCYLEEGSSLHLIASTLGIPASQNHAVRAGM